MNIDVYGPVFGRKIKGVRDLALKTRPDAPGDRDVKKFNEAINQAPKEVRAKEEQQRKAKEVRAKEVRAKEEQQRKAKEVRAKEVRAKEEQQRKAKNDRLEKERKRVRREKKLMNDALTQQFGESKKIRKNEARGYLREHFDKIKDDEGTVSRRAWSKFLRQQFSTLAGSDGTIDTREAAKDPMLFRHFKRVAGISGDPKVIGRRDFLTFASGNKIATEDTGGADEARAFGETVAMSNLDPATGAPLVMMSNIQRKIKEAEENGEEMAAAMVRKQNGDWVSVKVPKRELENNPFYAEEFLRMKENFLYQLIQDEVIRHLMQDDGATRGERHAKDSAPVSKEKSEASFDGPSVGVLGK